MIEQKFLEGGQRAALHSEALLERRAPPVDCLPDFEAFAERAGPAIRRLVGEAWSGKAVAVRALGVRRLSAAELAEAGPKLAANSLHLFGADHPLRLTLDGRAMLELLDCAFGGSGDIGTDLPGELPYSADLYASRLAHKLATAMAALLGIELRLPGKDTPTARPWAGEAELALLEFEVDGTSANPWRIALAVACEHMAMLFPRRAGATARSARPAAPGIDAFADLPLDASATLVDMQVPLHRLAGLAPGSVLPIAVARSVPLRVGDAIVARGSVGGVDDQVALEITQTFTGKVPQ